MTYELVYLGIGYKGDYGEAGFNYYKTNEAKLYKDRYTIGGTDYICNIASVNSFNDNTTIYTYEDGSHFICKKNWDD